MVSSSDRCRSRDLRSSRRMQSQRPMSVDHQRRRALTLPLPDPPPPTLLGNLWAALTRRNEKLREPTYDQQQSPFFSRLPLEIRCSIYAQALSHPAVHLFTFDKMTHGIICSCSLSEDESFGERNDYNDDPPPCFGCRESMLDLHRQPLTPMERGSAPKSLTCKNLLPLLQTCRQMCLLPAHATPLRLTKTAQLYRSHPIPLQHHHLLRQRHLHPPRLHHRPPSPAPPPHPLPRPRLHHAPNHRSRRRPLEQTLGTPQRH